MGQAVENRVIQITGIGVIEGFSVLMSNALTNHYALDKNQCFPCYFYANTSISRHKNEKQSHLFANSTEENKSASLQHRDAICKNNRENSQEIT
ncbi:hypothetical protein ME9_00788 [Bartonella taylorii 8TBB]|uniref:Type ISP restriction-modification enzyme LLaBIII C-terminal specificity domain-containing protein n=2 Tax=Bartonella taylorii TaxID=33046 RepID=A0A9P2RZP1_BARTA|nr:hypothetical protein ME9_00788 [Bartonella taylorii 8TBB]